MSTIKGQSHVLIWVETQAVHTAPHPPRSTRNKSSLTSGVVSQDNEVGSRLTDLPDPPADPHQLVFTLRFQGSLCVVSSLRPNPGSQREPIGAVGPCPHVVDTGFVVTPLLAA